MACTTFTPHMSLRGAKRRGNLKHGFAPLSPLTCHCEERSDVAISNMALHHCHPSRVIARSEATWQSRTWLCTTVTPHMSLRGTKRRGNLEHGFAPLSPLTCHCEERSDVAISNMALHHVRPATSRHIICLYICFFSKALLDFSRKIAGS